MDAQKNDKRASQVMEPGVVIAKKSYVFDIRKPFSNTRKFKVPYSEGVSLKTLASYLRDSLSPKGKAKKKAPPINMKALAFTALKYAILFSVLAGLGLMLLVWMLAVQSPSVPIVENQSFSYAYNFTNAEVISIRSSLKAYATVRFNGTGVNSTQILMRLYNGEIPREVMLLNSRRYDAENFESFRTKLKSLLTDSGLSTNEIRLSQLTHLPENKTMILIVPSGRVPLSFLGLEDPNFDMRKLTDSGIVIIYVGYSFEQGAIAEDGTVYPYTNISTALPKIGLRFAQIDKARLDDGFRMERPTYLIANAPVYHGGISAIGLKKGYLITFPNTLQGGWTNGSDAAIDMYEIIKDLIWLAPSTSARPYTLGNADKNARLEATPTLFSDPYTQRVNLTAQFVITVSGFNNVTRTKIDYVEFPLIAKGTLSHDESILPTQICVKKDAQGKEVNCDLYITADFNENVQRTEQMKIVAYKDGTKIPGKDFPIGLKSTRLNGEKISYGVKLPPGDYVLKVEDDAGYVYAQSFLHVLKVDIIRAWSDYEKDAFGFFVRIDGAIPGVGYEVKNIYISLDGQQNQSKESTAGGIVYQFSGVIPEGNHYFDIWVDGEHTRILDNFTKRREWWDNPIYQGMVVVAVIIFAIAFLIKRPESVILQLDVPDFPPLSKAKVPITREQACQLFDLVNTDYRWNYMPLRHGEVKNGFRKLSYKGRPILVSDYNLERILDQLEEEGLVKRSGDFYGLSVWEAKSKRSLDYLAVFRSLRDVFLNMSVFFTDFGERTDCDILVSAHDQYYIHIYVGPPTIQKALSSLAKGKTAIVFKDQDAVDAFKKSLSSTNKALLAIKMYLDNESLYVSTPAGMEKIVK